MPISWCGSAARWRWSDWCPPLSGLPEREMARLGKRDFAVLVERLRGHGLTPLALPPLDKLFNTVEYFVHHEDLRRAQPDWEPRELDVADRDELWKVVKGYGGRLVKDAGVPVVAPRTDTGDDHHPAEGRRPGRGRRAAGGGGVLPVRSGGDHRAVFEGPGEGRRSAGGKRAV